MRADQLWAWPCSRSGFGCPENLGAQCQRRATVRLALSSPAPSVPCVIGIKIGEKCQNALALTRLDIFPFSGNWK